MNILILGHDPIFASDIEEAFLKLGYSVKKIPFSTIEGFQKVLEEFDPTLVMTLGSPSYYTNVSLKKYLLSRKKDVGFKLIHWDTDGIEWVGLELQLMTEIEPDYIFTVCPQAQAYLESVGIATKLLPYGYSSSIHYPEPNAYRLSNDISFIGGSGYDLRKLPVRLKGFEMLIKPIFENGGRVEFYSEPFIKQQFKNYLQLTLPDKVIHNRCPYNQTRMIYNESFINLGIQNSEYKLTKRTFEILGCGGCMMVPNTIEVNKSFTDGKEVIISESPADTIEKLNFYQKNLDAYFEVRKQALIASKKYTYEERMRKMLEEIGIK